MSRNKALGVAVFVPLLFPGCQPPPAWTEDNLPAVARGPLKCGEPEAPAAGQCSKRCGEYRIEFEQLEGDCGRRPTQTTRLDTEPVKPPHPCEGALRSSDDRCQSSFDIRCPVKDGSGTTLGSIERGQLVWTRDGTAANGTLELRLFHADGEPKCRSSYQTKVRRL